MIDLNKLKNEITELDNKIIKETNKLNKLIAENVKGMTFETKVKIDTLKKSIGILRINRDRKVYQYHNYFNPFKLLFFLGIFIFSVFSIPASSNFKIHQDELAISEISGNYLGGYVRHGQLSRLVAYVEPVEGTDINNAYFIVNGCGLEDELLLAVADDEDINLIKSSTFTPVIKQNTNSFGSDERCVLNIEMVVVDSIFQNWEKSQNMYVGYAVPTCETSVDCKVASLSNARGYYYYDNLEITGAMSVIQSPRSSESYVYLETKDTLKIGSITSSSRNGVCGTDKDGQDGDKVYLRGRHVIVSNGVTLNGGAGAKCSGDSGGWGGNGGYLEILAIETIVLNGNINMNGGKGGDGYTRDERRGQDGGDGGRGGSIYIGKLNNALSSPSFTRTSGTVNLNGGDGGKGDDGNLASSSQSYSDGGGGGDGGDTERFDFSGLSKVVIGGTINMNAGNGGNGGRGRCKESNPYIGGSGGSGGRGGNINRLFLYSAQSKEILLTATINIKGGNGGDGGTPCDAGNSYGGTAGRLSGAGISLNCDFIFSGGSYTITMGNGGSYSTGGTGRRANGCRGGFYRPSDSKRPYFDSRGILDVRRNIKGVRGTNGDTSSNCPYMEAYWDIEYTEGLLAPTNNFNNFLPNRQYATYPYSVIYIGDEIDINVSDITLRETNFNDAVDYIVSNNTQLILFYLYDTSDNFISQLFTNSTLSGIPEGDYYIKMYNCRINNNHGCVSKNSNVFKINYINTTIDGYSIPDDLFNYPSKDFYVYCNYTTDLVGDTTPIRRGAVQVEMEGNFYNTFFEDEIYVYENTEYVQALTPIEISCYGKKRDFKQVNIPITNLTLSDLIIERPYGNPQLICIFPNQKNVVPLYQSSERHIMRLINLGNSTKNISAAFNYPLPPSIVLGMKTNNFTTNWGEYILLSQTPVKLIDGLGGYAVDKNLSEYSVDLWLFLNCSNANTGTDIIEYIGDYVFVIE